MGEGRRLTEQEKTAIGMCAQSVLTDLDFHYPLEPDRSLHEKLAVAMATEQVFELRRFIELLADSRYKVIKFTMSKPARIAGGDAPEMSFTTHTRIKDCDTLDEVMSTTSVIAIAYNPSVRALLSKEGYRLQFGIIKPNDPDDNVVEVDFSKK